MESGTLLAHVHAGKYVHFFKNQVLGIGSSAVESYWGSWKVHYQQSSPSGTQAYDEKPNMLSLFPIHLVFSPFKGRWWLGHTIGTPSLTYSFTAWGWVHLQHPPPGESQPWNVMIHNVSISLPIGNWTSIQGGFISVREPGFSVGQDGLNLQGKTQTTTWSVPSLKQQQWYVGWEFHFGGRL